MYPKNTMQSGEADNYVASTAKELIDTGDGRESVVRSDQHAQSAFAFPLSPGDAFTDAVDAISYSVNSVVTHMDCKVARGVTDSAVKFLEKLGGLKRKGRDSNPRQLLYQIDFPNLYHKPLRHLSWFLITNCSFFCKGATPLQLL